MDGKKSKLSQTSIDAEAHNILDELKKSTSPKEVATRQRAPTKRPAEDGSMVNKTYSITPNVTNVAQQVSQELPSIMPSSIDKGALEVD